jgi:hypothetical protein
MARSDVSWELRSPERQPSETSPCFDSFWFFLFVCDPIKVLQVPIRDYGLVIFCFSLLFPLTFLFNCIIAMPNMGRSTEYGVHVVKLLMQG